MKEKNDYQLSPKKAHKFLHFIHNIGVYINLKNILLDRSLLRWNPMNGINNEFNGLLESVNTHLRSV